MFIKRMLIVGMALVCVTSAAIGHTSVSAAGTDPAIGYREGRINTSDPSAPVAIYYDYAETTAYNKDGNPYPLRTVTAVALWGIDSSAVGHLELYVPVSDLIEAAADNGGWAEFSHNGFTLGYSSTGWFWVEGPGNYSFAWPAAS